MTRYWINVVSYEHVRNGVKAGITQSCHGKSAPLRRMAQGDWIIHYSPKESFGGKEPCQKFTSIGQVVNEEVYEFDMGGGFIPWRRDIIYLDSEPFPIITLLDQLSFTEDKGRNWGMMFRFGFFEIKEEDFKLIYKGMMGKPFRAEEVQNFLEPLNIKF